MKIIIIVIAFAISGQLIAQNTIDRTPSSTPNTGNALFGQNSGNGLFSSSGFSNSYFGIGCGTNTTTGNHNAFFGTASGQTNNLGFRNSFFGTSSGFSNTTGNHNAFFGYAAGYRNIASGNTFFGSNAGVSNTTGSGNVFVGNLSGENNIDGSDNTFSGKESGNRNLLGSNNSFYGFKSGFSNEYGSNNSFTGYHSGLLNTGSNNTFSGSLSGQNNIGLNNTFIGFQSGSSYTTGGINTGSNNTFSGSESGKLNTTGSYNSFYGRESGKANTSGSNNTFYGYLSGNNNLTGEYNTFNGVQAGLKNSTGSNNLFSGYLSGNSNINGSYNTFLGNASGFSNIGGYYVNGKLVDGTRNTFVGNESGYKNTSGEDNVFIGNNSGYFNSTGKQNVMVGNYTGEVASNQSQNTYLGYFAGKGASGIGNLLLGYNAGTAISGDYNIAIGRNTGLTTTTGNNNCYLGNGADGLSNNQFSAAFGDNARVEQNYSIVLGTDAMNESPAYVRVGIGNRAPQNKLHVTATSDPLRLDGVQSSTDDKLLVLAPNGVVKYRTYNSLGTSDDWLTFAGSPPHSNILPIYHKDAVVIGTNSAVFKPGTTSDDKLVVIGNININGLAHNKYSFKLDGKNALTFMPGRNSIAIGASTAGTNATDSANNIMIGAGAGQKLRQYVNWTSTTTSVPGTFNANQIARNNVLIGANAGYGLAVPNTQTRIGDNQNVMVGNFTGEKAEGSGNVYMGHNAGQKNIGDENIAIGNSALLNTVPTASGIPITPNFRNIAIGTSAGQKAYGNDCIYIGHAAGWDSKIGTNIPAPNNIFIGYESGFTNEGKNNLSIGYHSAIANKGNNNIFFGNSTGRTNNGDQNTVIGDGAYSYNPGSGTALNSNNSVFVGCLSGFKTSKDDNVFIGYKSGFNNIGGSSNSFLGSSSGLSNVNGVNNVFIGKDAASNNISGNENVIIGNNAGIQLGTTTPQLGGNKNVIIGNSAGATNLHSNSSGMVLLGDNADASATATSVTFSNAGAIGAGAEVDEDNVISIGKVPTGSFLGTRVCIGWPGVTTSGWAAGMLYVNGDCYNTTGGVWGTSDASLKTNIKVINSGLYYIKKLNPVNYDFKKDTKYNLPPEIQYGFIAQELKQVLPSLVRIGETGMHSVNYTAIIPILTKAIQEQQEIIEQTKLENDKLNEEVKSLENKLNMEVKSLEDKLTELSLGLSNLNSCCELNKLNKSTSENKNISKITLYSSARLDQNKPNPFTKETYIDYYIPSNSEPSKIEIFDQTGKKVLSFNITAFGEGRLILKNESLSQGIYNYQLIIGKTIIGTYKMQIVN